MDAKLRVDNSMDESTKFGESPRIEPEGLINDIESKFVKKKSKKNPYSHK